MLAQLSDIGITLVCTAGLALLGWWFFGRLLRPTPRGVTVVLYGQGDGNELEQGVRAIVWLRCLGLLTCPVAIWDCGLSPEGLEVARRLCARWPQVRLERYNT